MIKYIKALLLLSIGLLGAASNAQSTNQWAGFTASGGIIGTNSYGEQYYGAATGSVVDPILNNTVSVNLTGEVVAPYSCLGNSSCSRWSIGAGAPASYISSPYVTVAPSTSTNLIAQTGGGVGSYASHTLSFSRPVSNVVMSIYSLGQPGSLSAYTFTQPFTILNTAACSSGNNCLYATNNNLTLNGQEGAGTILFKGLYSSISWTVTVPEDFSGFNFGISGVPYVFPPAIYTVAPGSTTTVTTPITDDTASGGLGVQGGGTLNLSAVNTYTGPTAVDAGSTLAIAGSGSIANSTSVTNNGTLDITNATSRVSVQTYTQGSSGKLLMTANPNSFQQLNINGNATLAGSLSLNASPGKYVVGKYTLLTATGGVVGAFGSLSTNLSAYTNSAYGLTYDANDVYLTIAAGPNAIDTQLSLVNSVSALQNIYTLQNSVIANSFFYDCKEFGANNICISAGGRNTAVQAANGLNNTSGLLIAAYRPYQNYRLGAYIDQNLSVNNAGSVVSLGNNTPVIGLFGAWNQRLDGTGTEIKVAAAYGQKNTTITRQIVGASEPGSGSSQLNSQGAQVTAKYGFAVLPEVIVSPYVGMRYTQNNMGGYTEGTSATVTTPLTYSALNTNATTALAGVGASYRFIPKATLFASAGVESDTNTANGTYSASGLNGLTPINFNANPVKTRPTATLGAYYDVEKNQRIGITGIYRQEPFQTVSTTTVMATYTVGL
ncbi:autotransporter outer membrane beta-barrel domain-containing protein [Polynucleobacter sp. Ross1-W9]|uniref:autotransporter outer membrane beta-barrel domain-containing protein n=1 Tax=Polynucleobacter parvulilacunae TaxID=1855631 RepID=UPI001C0DD3DD|nr:autotransporter outer membrane beta-barrel domain-containing protein [Polynucleobacter parvulilacunae]MBU3557295.1 autotransporter outer membrane beta-barrel domain-containing protein [Polynucleobacter parvulilacunae]